MTVLLEAQGADLTARQLWTLLTATDVTAMLILQESEWTRLVTHCGSALLGSWAALTELTVVDIGEEAKGTVQGAGFFKAYAQFLPVFALTGSTAIVIQFEAINAVLLFQSTV